MRKACDTVYRLSGWIAAGFVWLILLIVLAQVGLNIADRIAQMLTGAPIGLLVPSYADFAGYFLAAASFFALADSFQHGAHIRVTLILSRLPHGVRRAAEVWTAGVALALSAYFTWYMIDLTHDSWRFNDLSPGLVPIPIWLPQAAMSVGLIVLTLALLDGLIVLARGRAPAYMAGGADLERIDK